MRTRSTGSYALLLVTAACSKSPPEPPRADAGPVTAAPPPQKVDAAVTSDPGWDLDPQDPARDYVRRYIKATNRYERNTDCVLVDKTTDQNGKRAVVVRETPTCGKSNAVRDVFYVDVAGDRLTVDDPATRAPLKPWPDGSAPDKPAAPVETLGSMRDWSSPMVVVFEKLKISPMSVQLFGRGTYVVVGVSGFKNPIARDAQVDEMRLAAQKLCAANQDRSFAMKEAASDMLWLRVKCPEGTWKWDVRR